MNASQLFIGLKFQNEKSEYGQYFYNEVTSIKHTKTGRIKAFITRKFRDNNGNVTIQNNIPMFNGAIDPNTYVLNSSNIIK